MTRDLGGVAPQVELQGQAGDKAAGEILDFWFGLTKEQQFARDDALDRTIAERFGAMRDAVLADGAATWRDRPDTLLAAIILLDQFSRNIHRGTPQAFEADDLAAGLTLHAIERGWEARYTPERRVFLYLPLMHAEDLSLQDLSVAKFEALGIEENLAFARDHRDAIARFGRFPGRNAALGRETTGEEKAWLEAGQGGW